MKKGLTALPKQPATWLAMLGPAGFSPVAPATAGSALIVAIGWFTPVPPLPMALTLLALGTVIAVWAAGEAEKELGHDAGPITIDEAIGQSITLLFCPHRIGAFIAAFALFRLFDIWKPPIADRAQQLPGGLGIVADDVVAGIVALIVLQALLWAQSYFGLAIL
jgi:phosphatidylglycerophosphatase A